MSFIVIGLFLAIAAGVAFFYTGRKALAAWDEYIERRDAHITQRNLKRFSMQQFNGTKASAWHK